MPLLCLKTSQCVHFGSYLFGVCPSPFPLSLNWTMLDSYRITCGSPKGPAFSCLHSCCLRYAPPRFSSTEAGERWSLWHLFQDLLNDLILSLPPLTLIFILSLCFDKTGYALRWEHWDTALCLSGLFTLVHCGRPPHRGSLSVSLDIYGLRHCM